MIKLLKYKKAIGSNIILMLAFLIHVIIPDKEKISETTDDVYPIYYHYEESLVPKYDRILDKIEALQMDDICADLSLLNEEEVTRFVTTNGKGKYN